MNAHAAAPGGIPFGKYQLLAPIGYGGMAEVWRARLLGPGGFAKMVVVKRILPHLSRDPSFGAMFTSEAALLSRLDHPNIIQVFEFSAVESELYIAMEYVEGLNLGEVMKRTRPTMQLPIGMALYVVREACRALAYAHALRDEHGQPLQLIHRDVSPSNLMVATDGRIKLLDFGIAKAVNSTDETTRTGVLKGKLGYLAPETIGGEELDLRADIFSIGVVLHELLTGARLFGGRDELQTLARVASCDVAPPSTLRPEISSTLDRICLQALARDRDLRYANADELAQMLGEELAHTPWDAVRTAAFVVEHELVPRAAQETPAPTVSLLAAADPSSAPTTQDERRRGTRGWKIALALIVVAACVGITRMRTPSSVPRRAVPVSAPALVPLADPDIASIVQPAPLVSPPRVVPAPHPAPRVHRAKPTKPRAHRVDLLGGDILE